MKRWFKNAALFGAAVLMMTNLVSCGLDVNDEMDTTYANAFVTVKPLADGGFVMRLDESTVLWPKNIDKNPFGNKEVRALANVEVFEDKTDEGYKTAKVNWIDSIHTTLAVPSLGSYEEDIKAYGNDPMDIIADWFTLVEDGYLNIHFRTYWGYSDIKHEINLVSGTNPDDPCEFRFCHNAKNDAQNFVDDGIVAFRISDVVPQSDKNQQITVKWNSFIGERTATFVYKPQSANK